MSAKELLSRENLTAYALGEMDKSQKKALEEALLSDPEARETLEEIRMTATLAKEVLSELPNPVEGLSPEQRNKVAKFARRSSEGVLNTIDDKGAGGGVMKITCDKCQAKYSIADEKVKGKTFKIKCKKCQNSIIVRGQADAQAAPTQAPKQPEKDSEDLFATDGGMFSKEGSGGPGDVFSAASGDFSGGGLFAEDSSPSEGVSPFDAPGTDEVEIPVDISSPTMTGQRGEDSVLFSLGNLQALADSGDESEQAAPGIASQAVVDGESSGLVDIRVLAEALRVEDSGLKEVDDLITMSPSALGSNIGAPVLSPAQRSGGMSTGVKIGLGVGGFVGIAAIVAVVVILMGPSEEPRNDDVEARIADLTKQIAELTKQGGSQQEVAKLQEELAMKQAEEAELEEDGAKGEGEKVASASKKTSKGKSAGGKAKAPGSKPAAENEAVAVASKPKRPAKSNDELDDLLGGATSGPKKKPKASSGSGGSKGGSTGGAPVADKLTRAQVQAGMNAVAKSVKRCGHGESGTVTVKANIAPTGRVTTAKTTGSFAGTTVGACAAGAVRRARFPKAKKSLSVTYPFKL